MRVFAPDLPGFGDSPEPAGYSGSEDYLRILLNWLDKLHITRLDIIAHSFGGRIAIRMAAEHPDLVGKLILTASAGVRPHRRMGTSVRILAAKSLRRLGQVVGGSIGSHIENRRQALGSADWRSASPVMRGVLSRVIKEDLSDEMKRITAPTLLLWGKDDRETPLWMGRRMAELIPQSKLTIIERAGHYPFLDRPGEAVAAVWKHLALPDAW